MIYGHRQPKEINDIFCRLGSNKVEQGIHYKEDVNYLIGRIDELQAKIDTFEAHRDVDKEKLIAFVDELNKVLLKHEMSYPIPCAD